MIVAGADTHQPLELVGNSGKTRKSKLELKVTFELWSCQHDQHVPMSTDDASLLILAAKLATEHCATDGSRSIEPTSTVAMEGPHLLPSFGVEPPVVITELNSQLSPAVHSCTSGRY